MQRSAPFLFPYKSWRNPLQNRGAPKVLTTEAVMAWNRIGNLAVLSLAFVFAACGEDSGSNGKTEIEESSQAEEESRE